MAKAVSTLVSIGLLVAADRAADYWQRAHHRAADQSRPIQMEADASSILFPPETPEIFPTNLAPANSSAPTYP